MQNYHLTQGPGTASNALVARRANPDLIDHERKRRIEVKLEEVREGLEGKEGW